jgi:hypothetical protein
MFHDSLIKKSGQMWKIYTMFLGILAITVSLIFWLTYGQLNLLETYFLLISLFLGSLLMLFGIFYIRCPYCGIHLPQYFIKNESYNLWLSTLLNCSKCPICKK